MGETAQFSVTPGEGGEGGDGDTLVLSGPLRVHTVGDLDTELAALDGTFSGIDISGVSSIDTAGAWLVMRLAGDCGASVQGASEQARRLMQALGSTADDDVHEPERQSLLVRTLGDLGVIVTGWGTGGLAVLGFLGAMIVTLGRTIRHPSLLRTKALVHQMQLVGVNSLFIIGLMSLLVGIVIAQQGAIQLQEFGAEIYTINLTGRLSMRELGVLMTAIMVAGRSGSSFAAQIGTMKLTEEVDAMRTIGVSPMETLVLPRVLAAMLMMVLLGFFASVMAIIGGAAISVAALDIPFLTFLSRIKDVVPLHDVWVGLVKAPVFGLIIAVAGCYHGMQVESNSEEVGLRTTQAVVTAIFTVIVLDAFFAVFFTEIGWG